jgi:hypothetical protein
MLVRKFGVKIPHTLAYSRKTLQNENTQAYRDYRPARYEARSPFSSPPGSLWASSRPDVGLGDLLGGESDLSRSRATI